MISTKTGFGSDTIFQKQDKIAKKNTIRSSLLFQSLDAWGRRPVRPPAYTPLIRAGPGRCGAQCKTWGRSNQNRRQKVFYRGALSFCGGAWHSKNWQKLNWYIVFHVSIWGAWIIVLGDKPPVMMRLGPMQDLGAAPPWAVFLWCHRVQSTMLWYW